jgi:hypothetical protein
MDFLSPFRLTSTLYSIMPPLFPSKSLLSWLLYDDGDRMLSPTLHMGTRFFDWAKLRSRLLPQDGKEIQSPKRRVLNKNRI